MVSSAIVVCLSAPASWCLPTRIGETDFYAGMDIMSNVVWPQFWQGLGVYVLPLTSIITLSHVKATELPQQK